MFMVKTSLKTSKKEIGSNIRSPDVSYTPLEPNNRKR